MATYKLKVKNDVQELLYSTLHKTMSNRKVRC